MASHDGTLPLPVMLNDKTVDPRDKSSMKVIQLETAMGVSGELMPSPLRSMSSV